MADKANMIEGSVLQDAYKRRAGEIAAVTEVTRPSMEASAVITIGMGARRNIAQWRPEILKLHTIKAELVNSLEDYLYAFAHAHTLYLMASTPVGSVPELAATLAQARDVLVTSNVALAKLDIMEEMPAKQRPGPFSHGELALDVLARATAFRERWADVQNKTAIQLSHLEAWETASARMLHALGERAIPEQDVSSANLNRHRAFTLFLRAYDEVRAGLSFLRRDEGDADELVPSLYTARNLRRKRSGAEEENTGSEGEPGAGGQGTPAVGDVEARPRAREQDDDSPFTNE